MNTQQLAVRWFQEIWNEKKSGTIHELMHPEALAHTEISTLQGPDAFHDQMFVTLKAAFPDLSVEIEDAISEGDSAVVRWKATATHMGALNGIPATQKKVAFSGLSWLKFRDGRIIEGWDRWNSSGLLGLLSQGVETVTAKSVE